MQSSLHLVVGLGKTGHSIARYLTRKNLPFVVFDTRRDPLGAKNFRLEFPGVDLFLGEFPPELYEHISAIICSPGVSFNEPFIECARSMGIAIFGDIDCLANDVNSPIIAITGTNGKSTVTTLVGEMAKASGLRVAVAGNIGLPVLDILDVGAQYDLWVLELSSFQLDLTHNLAPTIATILNVTPDHLDRHHTFAAYVQAKQRIYHHAKIILNNREDSNTLINSQNKESQRLISYGSDVPDEGHWGLVHQDGICYLAYGKERLLAVSKMRIRGKHNWLNALAACALADSVGIAKEYMLEVLARFPGLAHRSQWVRTLAGVDWINDSKGTNVGATISALSGIGGCMSGKIVLIAGGQGKGADFSELKKPILDYGRCVVLIGEDADKIERIVPHEIPVYRAADLNDAVQFAQAEAKTGDVVLLSPACASFDMFRDFNHRGDDFIAAVKGL